MNEVGYRAPGEQPPQVDDVFSTDTPGLVCQFTPAELAALVAYLTGLAGVDRAQMAFDYLHGIRQRIAAIAEEASR